MSTHNRYDQFDDYGLNHILAHLRCIKDNMHLTMITLDPEWIDCRRLQDPSNLLLLDDTNKNLRYVYEDDNCDLQKLVSICFLLTIIEGNSNDASTSKDIAAVLDFSNNASKSEKLAEFFLEHRESDIDAQLGFYEEYVKSGKIQQAQKYADKVLRKIKENKEKEPYKDRLGYSVFTFNRKISEELKTEYQKRTLIELSG